MNMINDKEIEFYKMIINDYEYWMKRFLKILYIIMFIIYDLLKKIKEMISLKFVNIMNNNRNIYLEDKQFMFIIEYHKSQIIMNISKIFNVLFQILMINHFQILVFMNQ